jgi:arylsulfatase A-like enzyme
VKPQWQLEGADLWPVITGSVLDLGVRKFYWSNGNREWAAREGDWKLIHGGDGANQLFNLVTDPLESTDVAAANPEVVQRLAAWIETQRAEIG